MHQCLQIQRIFVCFFSSVFCIFSVAGCILQFFWGFEMNDIFGIKSLNIVLGVLINFVEKLVFHFRIIVKYFEEQEESQ
jgi:hypothetical protein